jgi:superfamily I DNA and/or RNA helicase
VHAFQGSEFDIIILSLTAFNENFHINFITETPNLLNVAVSRAKNRLIVVGDKEYVAEQEGNLKKLLKYCS